MNKEELIRKIYSEGYIDKQINKIKLLGKNNKINVFDLMMTRLVTSVLFFIVIIFSFKYGYIIAPCFVVVYYFMFNKFAIDNKLKVRMIKLIKSKLIP